MFTGTMKTFTCPGGSGKPVLRLFCPECGSSIAEETGSASGAMTLNIGTLNDPKSIAPRLEVFADDAFPWVQTTGRASPNGGPEKMVRYRASPPPLRGTLSEAA